MDFSQVLAVAEAVAAARPGAHMLAVINSTRYKKVWTAAGCKVLVMQAEWTCSSPWLLASYTKQASVTDMSWVQLTLVCRIGTKHLIIFVFVPPPPHTHTHTPLLPLLLLTTGGGGQGSPGVCCMAG
jgi:hypothetical protein